MTVAQVPGARFTGLTETGVSGAPRLYAADFTSGKIDAFDGSFKPISLSSGAFTDPNLPTGYYAYNVQAIGKQIYVTYAEKTSSGVRAGRALAANGDGIVDVFDLNGAFVKRLVSPTASPTDNVPWAIVQAPSGFGQFGGDLLVGQFGSGGIDAYDPTTDALLGTLDGPNGSPLSDPGLWGMEFGNGADGASPDVLYFNAGIESTQGVVDTLETEGLFGDISVPEPSSALLLGSALLVLAALRRRWRAPIN